MRSAKLCSTALGCMVQANVIKKDKGAEDWEYEENAADDDEDMGEHDDLNNADASPPPRQ